MSLPMLVRLARPALSLFSLTLALSGCPRNCRDSGSTPADDVKVSTQPTLKRPGPSHDPNADAATAVPPAVGARNARSALGYNMDFPGDWSKTVPFLDLMHEARPWAGDGDDPIGRLKLDEQGVPVSLNGYGLVTSIIRTEGNPEFVDHVWLVTYEGEGEIKVDGSVEVLSKTPGSIRFRGKHGNVWLAISETDPKNNGNYIRNIHVVREDRLDLFQQGKLFNPDLLAYLAPFGSLRFMDWAQSNEGEQDKGVTWDVRSKLTQPQWLRQYIDPKKPALGTTRGGYPVEVIVALANEVGADPHVNMPYKFDDHYVREYAKVVRDKLAPNLVVTVEYSNEVWNWGFPQATYARLEAEKMWKGEGSGWVQYMGVRASRMCKLWKEVFAGQLHRVRCVIAPQTGWPELAMDALTCPRWVAMGHEPCYKQADAVAINGYFSGRLQKAENLPVIKKWLAKGKEYALSQAFRQLEHGTVNELKDDNKAAVGDNSDSLAHTLALFRRFKAMADKLGLELYVYEGGTHFDVGNDETHKQFLRDVARDDRMRGLYLKLFNGFRDVGGTVFNIWGWVDPDSVWANAATLNDRSHPKYRAVIDFVDSSPCWWSDCDRSKRR